MLCNKELHYLFQITANLCLIALAFALVQRGGIYLPILGGEVQLKLVSVDRAVNINPATPNHWRCTRESTLYEYVVAATPTR